MKKKLKKKIEKKTRKKTLTKNLNQKHFQRKSGSKGQKISKGLINDFNSAKNER